MQSQMGKKRKTLVETKVYFAQLARNEKQNNQNNQNNQRLMLFLFSTVSTGHTSKVGDLLAKLKQKGKKSVRN